VFALPPARVALLVSLLVFHPSFVIRAEVVRETESWEQTDEGFHAFGRRIRQFHGRNLLARRSARLFVDGRSNDRHLRQLWDGEAGRYGAEGRVMINGQPTVLNFYLGEAKTITEIGALTCNIDMRANQDLEVRVANNSRRPGTVPDFGDSVVLTTGETILGKDGGGFHTRFVNPDADRWSPSRSIGCSSAFGARTASGPVSRPTTPTRQVRRLISSWKSWGRKTTSCFRRPKSYLIARKCGTPPASRKPSKSPATGEE